MDPVDNIEELILARDAEGVRAQLARLPFNETEPAALYELLARFLDTASRIGSGEMVDLLLDVWGESNATEEKISTFSMLFLQPQIPVDVLTRVVRLKKDTAYDFVVSELMLYDDNPILTNAADRLDQVFGGRTFEQAQVLHNLAREEKCSRLERYYAGVMAEGAPFAAVPTWVLSVPAADLKTHDQLVSNLPSIDLDPSERLIYHQDTERIAEALVRSMREQGFEVEEVEAATDLVRQQLNVATNLDRKHFLEYFNLTRKRLDAGQNDTELFRVLGPVNLITGDRLEGDDVCCRWGGCRMLTCNSFERNDTRAGLSFHADGPDLDPGDEVDFDADWFMLRSCHECTRRIRSRAHALRIPLPYGGWLGCYCSRECVRSAMGAMDILNRVTETTLRTVIEQMETVGILDRVPDTRPGKEDSAPPTASPGDARAPAPRETRRRSAVAPDSDTRGALPRKRAALESDPLLDNMLESDEVDVDPSILWM